MKTIRMFCAAAAAVAMVVWTAPGASAQTAERLSLEGRVGVTFPTGDLSDAGASSGFALGADLMYNFTPALTGYGGISRHTFACDDDENCDDDFTSGGFQVGLKYLFSRDGRALPWARGGLIGQSLETDGADSDLGLGFEVGGGIDLDVTSRFAVVPALHFRSYSPDFDDEDDDPSINWFALTLGGHIHF